MSKLGWVLFLCGVFVFACAIWSGVQLRFTYPDKTEARLLIDHWVFWILHLFYLFFGYALFRTGLELKSTKKE